MSDLETAKELKSKLSQQEITIEELANFCKRKGFVFRSSDIYGGFAGFWDFGPLGVELFNNLKNEWWNFFVHQREDMFGMEASIISHPETWKASGHIEGFNDMLIYCKKNKRDFRADHLIDEILDINVEGMEREDVLKIIKDNIDKFEKAGYDLECDIKLFNLLFKTSVGALNAVDAYLRGETAQGMFMNFKLIHQTSRGQLPFGIAQIGRCFRNEIAPRDFLFRCREFHIGEFEYFINPDETKCPLLDNEHLNVEFDFLDAETQQAGSKEMRKVSMKQLIDKNKIGEWHAYWLAEQIFWFRKNLGLYKIKIREHTKDELSHYSAGTFDIDYEYPFGSKEVAGNANRRQYDLGQHEKFSGQKMEVFDDKTGKKIVPRVIEPTFGMERVFLALIVNAYTKNEKGEIVLKLPAKLTPYKAAILPLVKNDEQLIKFSREVFRNLKKELNVIYDQSGSIGRRYARNDEIGTPFCITVDADSLKDNSVTIRDRDTTKQIRIKTENLKEILRKLINKEIKFEEAGKLIS
ncbi:glycine--tRNA ligase [Candidatus Pacearchaeota archaeon]|nr:glycine--tRNA ligase [Candidatus Pacearchaeota archaeon]